MNNLSVRRKHTLDYYFIKNITLMNSKKNTPLTVVESTGVSL
jgi:hypothetical protein